MTTNTLQSKQFSFAHDLQKPSQVVCLHKRVDDKKSTTTKLLKSFQCS